MRLLKPITFILVMIFTIPLFIFIVKQEQEETYIITLESGTVFKANRITYYNSGVADIRKSNNERVQIPTRAIKEVKILNLEDQK